jgi:DeoR/GlpR family transcriptional regulator of sugar metabolism
MNTRLKSERQDDILKEVLQRGPCTIAELAAYLEVSEITVRRDLDELHEGGFLERVRGGARPPSARGPEPPVIQRQFLQQAEKQAIGLAAARMVADGDVIALETGSTTLEFAHALARSAWQNLQVVTNGLLVAEVFMRLPGVQLVLIGGYFRADEMGIFGVLAEDMLKSMHINKLFIGCRGIDPADGITTDLQSELEVFTVRAMAAVSDQVTVLADHTKFSQRFMLNTLPVTEIDTVVTDNLTSETILERLRRQDIQVIVAPIEDTNP